MTSCACEGLTRRPWCWVVQEDDEQARQAVGKILLKRRDDVKSLTSRLKELDWWVGRQHVSHHACLSVSHKLSRLLHTL